MKDIIKSIKNILPIKKEPNIKDLFNNMSSMLEQAENDFGGNVFPKEKLLSSEQVHYKILKLKAGADFEKIKTNYQKLKQKYNPELYKNDEIKYQKALEANTKIDIAYNYFKNKFQLNN